MSTSSDASLDRATQVAHRLVTEAIWHGGRCTWIGPMDERPAVRHALGPDLYSGTAGVAWFLAYAGVNLDEPAARAAARGAILHAIDRSAARGPGLYVGSLGVVLAAVVVAEVLEDASIRRHAIRRLARLRRHAPALGVPDLLDGEAGVALALLALHAHFEDDALLEAAVLRGDRLLHTAERSSEGWSWRGPDGPAATNLCGLAHGTCGVGLALLELFAATGEACFREAAEQAFEYGRTWRRRAGDAWPDLRGVGRRAAPDAPIFGASSWCHGAPGALVAHARRAHLLDGAEMFEATLAETHAIADRLVAEASTEACLCHGTAGVADALLYADGPSGHVARIAEQAHRTLPLGPGLFTGAAGLGLLALRVADGSVPTPLAVTAGMLDQTRGLP